MTSQRKRRGRVYRCIICYRFAAVAKPWMCASCGRSFDRWNQKQGTTLELMVWCAKRSRVFTARELRAALKGAKTT